MRILKFFAKCVLAFLLAMLVFWGIIFGILQTESGREWMLNQCMGYFERTTETQIEIGKVQFSFPLCLSLEDVVLSQKDRPLITFQHVDICCAYAKLIQGKILFSTFRISGIDILQLPKSEKNRPHRPADSWFPPPVLPFYVKFEHMDIQNIRLDPSLIHVLDFSPEVNQVLRGTSLRVEGMMKNHPLKGGLTAHLLTTIKSEQGDFTPFHMCIDAQDHQASLSLHFHQLPLQLLKNDLPDHLKARLSLYASAPFSTWQRVSRDRFQEGEGIKGDVKLTLQGSSEDSDFLSTLVGEETVLQSQYHLKSHAEVEWLDVRIENPSFFVHGEGLLDADQKISHAHMEGEVTDLEHFQRWFGSKVEGKLSFEGELNGSLRFPVFALHLKTPHLLISDQLFQQVDSTLDVSLQDQQVAGLLSLAFSHQSLPWKVFTAFDWNDQEQLTLSPLRLEAMHSNLEGKMSCSTSDFIWEGSLKGGIALRDISHLFPDPVAGNGQLNVQWMPLKSVNRKNKQRFYSEFIGQEVSSKEWQVQELILRLDSSGCQEEGHSFQGTMQFAVREMQSPGIQFEELTGSTTFDSKQQEGFFYVKGKGVLQEEWLFAAEGNWHLEGDLIEGEVQRLKGRLGRYPLQINQPLQILRSSEGIKMRGAWMQWGEAEIQGELNLKGQTFATYFKTNAISSELFHLITPDLPLAGRAIFQGYLEGSLDQPKGQVEIDLRDVQVTDEVFGKNPFIKGKVIVDLDERGIQVNSELNGLGDAPVRIFGNLPFHISLRPFRLKQNPNLLFDLALKAEGELDPYIHLFYYDMTRLSGVANIDLRLSGQINAPQVRGRIDLIHGVYESLSTGAVYHDIQAHLEGDGSRMILKEFSAEDNKNGSIAVKGMIELNSSQHFPFAFQINLARLFVLDSDYVDISVSGPLKLKGNMKQSKLEGKLTIDQATVRLEEALPRQIKNIDIKYINLAQGEESLPHDLEEKEAASAIELEIKLNAPQVHIEGEHLKSEWKGNVLVTGTAEHPLLHGDVRIVQGEYDFNGKTFNLSEGNIHFAGTPDKKTTLYIVASKEMDRITAEIIVKGAAHKPAIRFRSNPPLSQADVLSYILFNHGTFDMTSDEEKQLNSFRSNDRGEQLSQSLSSLQSSEQSKGFSDLISRFRNNIRLDRLDFVMSQNKESIGWNGLEFQVGKHITENVMVTINQGMTSLSPIIAVEAKLHKNLKAQAQAEVGEDAPIRMSIKWKKDY